MADLNVGDRFYPEFEPEEFVVDQVTQFWYRASSFSYPEKWFRKSVVNYNIKKGTTKVLVAAQFDEKGDFCG